MLTSLSLLIQINVELCSSSNNHALASSQPTMLQEKSLTIVICLYSNIKQPWSARLTAFLSIFLSLHAVGLPIIQSLWFIHSRINVFVCNHPFCWETNIASPWLHQHPLLSWCWQLVCFCPCLSNCVRLQSIFFAHAVHFYAHTFILQIICNSNSFYGGGYVSKPLQMYAMCQL